MDAGTSTIGRGARRTRGASLAAASRPVRGRCRARREPDPAAPRPRDPDRGRLASGGQSQSYTVTFFDQFGNQLDSTSATTHITVSLSPGATPDGGTLSTAGQLPTAPDATTVSLALTMTSTGTVAFSYNAPSVAPLNGSGTISFSGLSSNPTSFIVSD